MGRYAEAIGACEAAIALQPDLASAHFNLACSLLVRGDFERGWDEYIWSLRVPAVRERYPYLDRVPLWKGESFAGRQLLVTLDQGFGDAIQMVRYLPAVKARGGRVLLEVDDHSRRSSRMSRAPMNVALTWTAPTLQMTWICTSR